jgi:hypothetical protein
MTRTFLEWRVKINKGSLQLYHNGAYIGSCSLQRLCQYVEKKQDNGTAPLLAQKSDIAEQPPKVLIGTN